jgi:hypothetical protein
VCLVFFRWPRAWEFFARGRSQAWGSFAGGLDDVCEFHRCVTVLCACQRLKESDYSGCCWFSLLSLPYMAILVEMWCFFAFVF